MDSLHAKSIEDAIREIIARIAPDTTYAQKYGGHVIVSDADDPKHFVGGLFHYKDHVSLEFSQGASLSDPDGALEGAGKARRHLKFRTLADVGEKGTADFLKQVLA